MAQGNFIILKLKVKDFDMTLHYPQLKSMSVPNVMVISTNIRPLCGNLQIHDLRLFVVVYKLVKLLLLLIVMGCMCIQNFVKIVKLKADFHRYICLHYNVWPWAIFHSETETKGLTKILIWRCTSRNQTPLLCKISWSEEVWLLSYGCRIKEEEEEEDEQFGKSPSSHITSLTP